MPASSSSIFIPDYGNINDPNIRAKYGYIEAGVSIAGNFLLFLLKLILGIFINSIALIADAFHTLSDVGTSGVVIFGFRLAKKPADKEHPFGHGRAEYIATLIIAILLVFVGITFIIQSGERILNMVHLVNKEIALIIGIIVIISAVGKELMAQFSTAIGKKIKSDVLIADAWHHRSDAVASVAVGLSIIGSTYGYPLLDPIFGIIVSIIIIYVGVDLGRKTSNILIGSAPDDGIIDEIRKVVKPVKEAKDIDKIFVHDYGTDKIISLHLNVKRGLPIEEAHDIADKIEDLIKQNLGFSTIIHMEPKETKEDEKLSKYIIQDILNRQKEIVSFHKVMINSYGKKLEIKMHVVVDEKMPIKDSHKLHHKLQSKIRDECGDCNIAIHIEPCENLCEGCNIACERRVI